MPHKIIIESELYERLANYAEGFDTPANVIEKMLNHFDLCPNRQYSETAGQTKKRKKNFTKYSFNGQTYGKSRLVLAVIKYYVSKNPSVTFDNLCSLFPKQFQGSMGVINKYDYVQDKLKDKTNKRHFVKSDELIQLSDCTIAVCTEWGASNINSIIQKGNSFGYNISAVDE